MKLLYYTLLGIISPLLLLVFLYVALTDNDPGPPYGSEYKDEY